MNDALIKILPKMKKFEAYINDVKKDNYPITVSGLGSSQKVHMMYATRFYKDKPMLIVTYNDIELRKIIDDMKFFSEDEILVFPKKDVVYYDIYTMNKDATMDRIIVYNKLYNSEAKVIITTIEALMQKTISKNKLFEKVLQLETGKDISLDLLKESLGNLGYERTDMVEGRGQYTVRGGIIDFFPLTTKNPVRIEDTYIDLGVSSIEEVEKMGIKIGDMITPYLEFEVLNNEDYLLAKAWDNRIGCAMVIKVLEELKNFNHPNVVYSVGTVQEEVGYRGAKTSAELVEPDIAIALDVSIATDVPGSNGMTRLGAGPGLLIYDSQLVGHVGLRDKIVEIAEELNIPFQYDYLKTSGTDSGRMHTVHAGCPAISFCIETRYIHSHTSIINYKDYENGVKLIVELIKRLDRKTVNEITYD